MADARWSLEQGQLLLFPEGRKERWPTPLTPVGENAGSVAGVASPISLRSFHQGKERGPLLCLSLKAEGGVGMRPKVPR